MTGVCDAYSGHCVTPPPTTPVTHVPREELPRTGSFQVGDAALIALLLILLGVVAVVLVRTRRP